MLPQAPVVGVKLYFQGYEFVIKNDKSTIRSHAITPIIQSCEPGNNHYFSLLIGFKAGFNPPKVNDLCKMCL